MALANLTPHYCEGAAKLRLGDGFFRRESRPSRDLSVLLAWHQAHVQEGEHPLRWLDLMAGCGIRALRWALEAAPSCRCTPDLWVNDADPDRLPLLKTNLAEIRSGPCRPRFSIQSADHLLIQSRLRGRRFDLIDLDAFGNPTSLIQPALQALGFGGILFLASTDGRSPTGHDRGGAIRSFGAAARVHPASWELALRQQLGLLARQAWMLGFGLKPLLSFSDGRTFRTAIRLRRHPVADEEQQLGMLARCEACGDQQEQRLLQLKGWPTCRCPIGSGRWMVNGPLWLGPLQDTAVLETLLQAALPIAPATQRLLKRLVADPGSPARVWSTAELSHRCALQGPPALTSLVQQLQDAGHQACVSGVMPGQLRTDAELPELLQICCNAKGEGT